MFDLDSLGQVIWEVRIRRGLTQQDLADRAQVHRTYISDIERGRRNITVGMARQLADALQIGTSNMFRLAETKFAVTTNSRKGKKASS